MSGPVLLLTRMGSVGLRAYCEDLATALGQAGVTAELAERPSAAAAGLHFHLSNSTRHLIRHIALAPKPSPVTVHDVVARDPRVRPFLAPVVVAALRGHRAFVHSRHAEEMLRAIGFRGSIDVIGHPATETRFPPEKVEAVRRDLSPDGKPIVMSAGLLRVARGVLDVLEAAAGFPDLTFAFVGRPLDAPIATSLASAGPNVVHRPELRGTDFLLHLAAADVLVEFRPTSVGESSGPVVQARGVGTPIAGYRLGSLPEACGERDLLYETGTPVPQAIADVASRLPLPRQTLPDPKVVTWETAARRLSEVYRGLGWIA